MPINTDSFKAYDIRGKVPDELDEDLAYRIGRAYVDMFNPKRVVVGRDIRLSGPEITRGLIRGLNHGGCHVLDIGICGTEEVYFATSHGGLDGGIMVTASHNPPDYNGMKFVREKAIPVSGDSGLREMEAMVKGGDFKPREHYGEVEKAEVTPAYIEHLLAYVEYEKLKPLKIACNPGNGCAGPILKLLEEHLPFELFYVHDEPDGTFPNGVPNPLLPENRETSSSFIRETGADLGIAWDGDFDRCFFFDENGDFIEGYYIVGILAQEILKCHPGQKIIHDPRLIWNTIEIVEKGGGEPVQCKTGHAFIKERMRKEDAVYGGEMSAHHYFRSFSYCDSGMIPWLLLAKHLSEENRSFSALVQEMQQRYPVSGEINREVMDKKGTISRIENEYKEKALSIDYIDGLSMSFHAWRFNLRKSNTEPLLRLNIESRGDQKLLKEKTREILDFIESG